MIDWIKILLQPFILVLSLIILIKFSDVVSESSTKVAKVTGLGEMAVGFLLLSVVTSLPELAVSVSAVRSGDVSIPIGGLFGSNIANIGLILGLTAILAPTSIQVARGEFKSISFMTGVAASVPLLLLIFGTFNYIIGWALLALFVAFSGYSIRNRFTLTEDIEEMKQPTRMWKDILFILGGVVIILVSSQFVVNAAVEISNLFRIDQAVIGATIIAVGTSLPEFSVSLAAVKKGRTSLALGNILGSCLTNLTLILGFVLAFSTFNVNLTLFLDMALMLILINFVLIKIIAENDFGLLNGLILLFFYGIFLLSTFGIQIILLSPQYLTSLVDTIIYVIAQLLPYGLVGFTALILGLLLSKG